jgi:hypothetical protein
LLKHWAVDSAADYPEPTAGARGTLVASELDDTPISPSVRVVRPRLQSQNASTAMRQRRGVSPSVVSLPLILAVQAFLSLRLVHLDTAFADEALYLWVGHMDWAHLVHGTPMPPFPTYLSGSPVFYPPIGAIADALGGLAGARVLSLVFMMSATVLLWMTTDRLYGRTAAVVAAALWSLLGETLRLGAFATYDPMACAFLCLGAYAAVRAAQSKEHGPAWAIAAALALTVANCTKYATGVFDPVVVCLVITVSFTQEESRKRAARLAVVTGGYLAIFLVTLFALATQGNGYYSVGIAATTTARPLGGQSAAQVMSTVWPFILVIAPLTIAGAAACLWLERDLYKRLTTLLLALAGALAPLNQIRIHTGTSLDKHEDFAAWFMAIAAGYGISALSRTHWSLRVPVLASATAALIVNALLAEPFAAYADSYWSNTSDLMSEVLPLVHGTRGEILFQNPSILEYSLGKHGEGGWSTIWKRVSGQSSMRTSSGSTIDNAPVGSDGVPGPYIAAVKRGYFALIVLNSEPNNSFDAAVIPVVRHDPRYKLIGGPAGFYVWEYESGSISR